MDKKKELIGNAIVTLVIVLVMGASLVITSMGKDTSNKLVSRQIQLLTLDKDANAYAEPTDNSKVLRVIKAGTAVAVVGEEGDYTVIIYQDHDEYIKTEDITKEAVAASQASAKERAEEVDEEYDKFKKEDAAYLESLERQRIKSRNAVIWKTIIVILVIAIVLVSVVMGVKNAKDSKNPEADMNGDKEENKS